MGQMISYNSDLFFLFLLRCNLTIWLRLVLDSWVHKMLPHQSPENLGLHECYHSQHVSIMFTDLSKWKDTRAYPCKACRTFSCILCDDGEGGSFVGYSIHKAWTICRHTPTVGVVHVELEGALCICQG